MEWCLCCLCCQINYICSADNEETTQFDVLTIQDKMFDFRRNVNRFNILRLCYQIFYLHFALILWRASLKQVVTELPAGDGCSGSGATNVGCGIYFPDFSQVYLSHLGAGFIVGTEGPAEHHNAVAIEL